MTTKTDRTPAESYKAAMAGEPVTRAEFHSAVDFAKEKKRKRPTEEGCVVVDVTRPKPAAKPAAKKAAKPAAKPAKDGEKPAECLEEDCDRAVYAKGRCSRHYTAHRRATDPAIREAANQASREYRQRMTK